MKVKGWIYLFYKMMLFGIKKHPYMAAWMSFWACWGVYVALGDGKWLLRLSTTFIIGIFPYGIYKIICKLDGHSNKREKEQFLNYLKNDLNKESK